MSNAKALSIPEILDQVISKLDDQSSLLAGALVCSDWLHRCRVKAFSGKVFRVCQKDWAQYGKNDARISVLLNSLHSTIRPFITAVQLYIREDDPTCFSACSLLTQCGLRLVEIQIEWDPPAWYPQTWGHTLMECVQTLLRSKMPTLQTCRLLGRGSSRISTCLLEALSPSTTLQHLVIRGIACGDLDSARCYPPLSLRTVEVDRVSYSEDVIPGYLRACGPDVAISVTNMMSMVGGSSDIQDFLESAPGRRLHLLKLVFDYSGEYAEAGMDSRQFLIHCGNRISHLSLILTYPFELDLSQMTSLVSLEFDMRLSSEEVLKNIQAVVDSIRSLPSGHGVKSIQISFFNFTGPRGKESLVDQVIDAWMSEMSDSGVRVTIDVRQVGTLSQSARVQERVANTGSHVEKAQPSVDTTYHEDETIEESEEDDIVDMPDSDDDSESEFSGREYAEQLLELPPDEFPLCLARSGSRDFLFIVHRLDPDVDIWAPNAVTMEGYY